MTAEPEWGEFCNVFGPTPRNRVLEFFLALRSMDFGIGDVAEDTGLNRATAYYCMKGLIADEFVLPTRKVGNTQLYKLNDQKPEVKAALKAFDAVLQSIVQQYAEKNQKHLSRKKVAVVNG